MGSTYERLSDDQVEWMGRQHVFFVATAPSAADGHINCSPKGGDTFRVIDPLTVAYLDLTGSGAETIAHIRENGRLVIMFCDFEGPARIFRLYGKAEVILPGHADYESLSSLFPAFAGTRSVIRLRLNRIADSCGMAVPFMRYDRERTELNEWAEDQGPQRLAAYRNKKNQQSIDGLPALDA